MHDAFVVAAVLCLSGVSARTGYEMLKKEKRIDTRRIASVGSMAFAMTLFLSSWAFMCPSDPARAYRSTAGNCAGLAVALAGLCLASWGAATLRGIENIDRLVTAGPFAVLRHPMYTGFVLWISGWVICFGSVASALIAAFCVGNILFWRRLEERAMEGLYGGEYIRYRERTWF
jgi:protein-S-isoprenylcysteine O-methyltransferase Ste14